MSGSFPRQQILHFLGVLVSAALVSGCASTGQPTTHCRNLESHEAVGLTVGSAEVVSDWADLPEFCRVRGTIDPGIGFEARLPMNTWNGKYYQSGCGGYCGAVLADKKGYSNTINAALKRGYSTITTDNGHQGAMGDASWAKDNPEALEVYAHRGIALTHRAGTALTRQFYGTDSTRAYFSGCSNGGRMAAMAAQRYPDLFDGILGGAGVLHLSYSGGVYGSWVVQSNTGADGKRMLTHSSFAHKLPYLGKAALAQCDAVDGVEDGVISQPRNCTVDLEQLPSCGRNSDEECLTETERKVIGLWYQGPRDSNGRQLFPGMPPGSERYWGVWFLDREDAVAGGNALGGDYARYIGFPGGAPDDYSVLDFDFDKDPGRLGRTGALVDATNPDLTAFRDAGGKFLMWHGWSDPLVLPDQSLSYYDNVAELMGGFDAVRPFFRLFMIPGHGHCWELPSQLPDLFNPIQVLEDWVEAGNAPDSLSVKAANAQPGDSVEGVICPHPAELSYSAGGDYRQKLECES